MSAIPRLVRVAISLLKDQKLRVIPTHKDGGFAIIDSVCLKEAVSHVLSESSKHARMRLFNISCIDLVEAYRDASMAISVSNSML